MNDVRGAIAALLAETGATDVLTVERLPVTGAADVVVAHDLLGRVDDPDEALRALAAAARHHLVLSAPREPLLRLGLVVTDRLLGGGRRHHFSSPDLMRLVSRVGGVCGVRHPLGWTVIWVRRN